MLEKGLFITMRILSVVMLGLFVLFFVNVDILPFVLLFFVSAILILIKKNEDNEKIKESLEIGYFTNFQYIIRILAMLLFIGGSVFVFFFFGIDKIHSFMSTNLMASNLFRYTLYGLFFPCLITYITTWMYSNYRPVIYGLNSTCFILIGFTTLFLGLLICMNWEVYLNLQGLILDTFHMDFIINKVVV